MLRFIFNTSKLFIYSIYTIYKLKYLNKISNKDKKIINKYINNSGCITIKCVQWLIPILENSDINKEILDILNNVYENNDSAKTKSKIMKKKICQNFHKNKIKNLYNKIFDGE